MKKGCEGNTHSTFTYFYGRYQTKILFVIGVLSIKNKGQLFMIGAFEYPSRRIKFDAGQAGRIKLRNSPLRIKDTNIDRTCSESKQKKAKKRFFAAPAMTTSEICEIRGQKAKKGWKRISFLCILLPISSGG